MKSNLKEIRYCKYNRMNGEFPKIASGIVFKEKYLGKIGIINLYTFNAYKQVSLKLQ
jgi:hypothetical protein